MTLGVLPVHGNTSSPVAADLTSGNATFARLIPSAALGSGAWAAQMHIRMAVVAVVTVEAAAANMSCGKEKGSLQKSFRIWIYCCSWLFLKPYENPPFVFLDALRYFCGVWSEVTVGKKARARKTKGWFLRRHRLADHSGLLQPLNH